MATFRTGPGSPPTQPPLSQIPSRGFALAALAPDVLLRQILFSLLATVFAGVLYLLIAPSFDTPRHPYQAQAYLTYVYGNFMMFWVIADNRPRLAATFLWMFFAYFVALPAFFQLHDGFPWVTKGQAVTDAVIRGALAVLIIGLMATAVGQLIGSFALRSGRDEEMATVRRPAAARVALAIVVACVLALVLASMVGLDYFLSTRHEIVVSNRFESLEVRGLLFSLPRVLALLSLLYYFVIIKHPFNNKNLLILWLIGIGAIVVPVNLIINFPLAVARFWFFGAVIAIIFFLISFDSLVKRILLFITIIFSAFIVMPFANYITRGYARGEKFQIHDLFSFFRNYMLSHDVNNLQMIVNAYYYVQENGIAHGRQIMSALLFFVPRSIWPGKAIPSGGLAGDFAGLNFLAIAQPIYGEFYLDGGFLGVLIGSLALGIFLTWIDRKLGMARKAGDHMMVVLICAYIGMSIILYRGALGGVVPSTLTLFGLLFFGRFILTTRAPRQSQSVGHPSAAAPRSPARRPVAARWSPDPMQYPSP